MCRLSYIVPFYGVEKYIEECIRSLYDQDIPQEEYEVICVDDCSKDGSKAIVERLQKEYPTLRILEHTENKRQGGARNTGMREAKGKYVWFVDSDDYIRPNCLKEILERAEQYDLDILQIYYKQEGFEPIEMVEYGPCTGSQYVFDAPDKEQPILRCCVVWRGIVRRDLLIKNNIWFAENVQFEDDDFAYLMYAQAKRVYVLPIEVYMLRSRTNSTTHRSYTYQTASYYSKQIARFIQIEPTLRTIDKRWSGLIREIVQWTCEGMLLANMQTLALEEQKLYYANRVGYIHGLWKWVPYKTWLSLHYYGLYKFFYSK